MHGDQVNLAYVFMLSHVSQNQRFTCFFMFNSVLLCQKQDVEFFQIHILHYITGRKSRFVVLLYPS